MDCLGVCERGMHWIGLWRFSEGKWWWMLSTDTWGYRGMYRDRDNGIERKTNPDDPWRRYKYHYIRLHCIVLHCITSLDFTLLYFTLLYSTLHYIHTYIHTYVHTYIRIYVHTYIRTYVHTYIRTYVHTYIRTYVHTYIHTYIHCICKNKGT